MDSIVSLRSAGPARRRVTTLGAAACGASAHRRTGRRARKDTRGRRFVTFGDVITGVRGDVIRACGVT